MKRVLFVLKTLGRGGTEQVVATAARHFDRSSFTYEIAYLLRSSDALVDSLLGLNLPVHCLDGDRGLGWLWRLRRLVRDREIDLVHVHSPYVAVGARLALRGRHYRPIVYTEHSIWEAYRPATRWGNMLTYSRNDHVFAVSRHVVDSIRYPIWLRRRSMPPVELRYQGIDGDLLVSGPHPDGVREELGLPAGAPVVGTVANFTVHKAHPDLLRAFEQVRRSVPDARLVLVGSGPEEGRVRRLARELGLDGTVLFTGARADVPRVAGVFDVFALSSIQEGLAIAVLEAMALGIPCVATDVGGVPEVVVDGEDGIIVPPRDPSALADAIVSLLRDPALRKRMGSAARRQAARFDIRETVRASERIYKELLGRSERDPVGARK
jgi:glycosyltransferase involved in cell wall biosynthesis